MVAYTRPQQRKKEESERLRVEKDQIKFIDLRFERRQVVGFRKARRRRIVTRNIQEECSPIKNEILLISPSSFLSHMISFSESGFFPSKVVFSHMRFLVSHLNLGKE